MSDIRTDPETLRVYWDMRGMTDDDFMKYPDGQCSCGDCISNARPGDLVCIPDPITMSIGDLAFWMRDASDREAWEFYLVEEWYRDKYRSFASNSRHAFQHSTPEQWIDAAVKVWEAKK